MKNILCLLFFFRLTNGTPNDSSNGQTCQSDCHRPYGTGEVQQEMYESPATVLIGKGPLIVPGSEFQPNFRKKAVTVYPIRGFTQILHPFQAEMLLSLLPGTTLSRLNLEKGNSSTLLQGIPKQGPWFSSCWSADWAWIVYMQGNMFSPPVSQADIWEIKADGTGAVNLTPDSPGNDGFPGISADGSRVVFRSGRTGNYDVYLMNADGTNPINLTNHPYKDAFPAISPDGKSIVFSSNREGDQDPKTGERTYELYWLGLTNEGAPGELKRLTNSPGQDAHAQFSPDGEWIVFASERGGISDEEPLVQEVLFAPQMYGELYVIRLSDGNVVRLTHNKWEDGFPSWVGPVRTTTETAVKK